MMNETDLDSLKAVLRGIGIEKTLVKGWSSALCRVSVQELNRLAEVQEWLVAQTAPGWIMLPDLVVWRPDMGGDWRFVTRSGQLDLASAWPLEAAFADGDRSYRLEHIDGAQWRITSFEEHQDPEIRHLAREVTMLSVEVGWSLTYREYWSAATPAVPSHPIAARFLGFRKDGS